LQLPIAKPFWQNTGMIFFLIILAGAVIWGLIKLGNPLKPPKRTKLPEPITPDNLHQALAHIAETYGRHEHEDAHDEAHGPAPILTPVKRARGRPKGAKTATPSHLVPRWDVPPTEPAAPKPVAETTPAQATQVLATALKIPAILVYGAGHHAGESREVIITSVLGHHAAGGEFAIETIRCLCIKVKQFRTFKVDSIISLADGATGEIVPDVQSWLNEKLAALV
jgi:hypothetical protein